jgi:GNAT superfamily N-acetyltransferase
MECDARKTLAFEDADSAMMNPTFSIRPMQPGEETQVYELVMRVFDEYVAPDFPPEGVEEFLKFIQPDVLRHRSATDSIALLATLDDEVVGVIELRDLQHISLYFVDQAYMGQGIGRDLWRQALAICRRERPDLSHISVNASLYAVPVYERLGFRQWKPEQVVKGIRFVPMAFTLKQADE